MKKIVFLTPPDARYGFSLTGVQQRVTPTAAAVNALLETTRDPATGVAVLDERLVDPAVQKVLAELQSRWPGVVVVLPAPQRIAEAGADYALRMIRRAVGYQVRLSL